jgi:alanine-glyoxylate transaminase/serine-glyoxylate transaminase/serine-pyruvate transaminase
LFAVVKYDKAHIRQPVAFKRLPAMPVKNGRQFLAIPGPTTVPDEVLAAMHRPAVDIYTGELVGLTETCLADLHTVFRTTGQVYIYAANGHGAWEAALTNVLNRGDKVLVLESGRFATSWGEMAAMLGVDVEVLPGDWHRAVDPQAVEDRLRADSAGEIKAVMVVQVDTASGVINDIDALRQAMNAAGHDALFLVDAIASLATMPFEMDEWGVDVTVTGSQKGLMTPPGLSFVAAGERAKAAHQNSDLRTYYWDWTIRDGELHYHKYCGTPPEHLLFGLRKALDMLLEEGLEATWERHRLLAQATRAAVGRWAEGGVLGFNVTASRERSNSVTTVSMEGGHDPADLLAYCEDKCGVILGVGIGDPGYPMFRIAHMGHVNAPMMLGTLGVTEMALSALDIPHASGGVQAAIDSLAVNVSP